MNQFSSFQFLIYSFRRNLLLYFTLCLFITACLSSLLLLLFLSLFTLFVSRKRWRYKLDPQMKHDKWTTEEDELLLQIHALLGNRWAKIGKCAVCWHNADDVLLCLFVFCFVMISFENPTIYFSSIFLLNFIYYFVFALFILIFSAIITIILIILLLLITFNSKINYSTNTTNNINMHLQNNRKDREWTV